MKQLKSVAGLGPFLIVAGYVYYSVVNLWNVWVQVVLYTGIALTLLMLSFNFGRIKSSFRRRSTQYGTNTIVMTVVVIGILGMINFVGKRHHKRLDLTSAKLYSLSDQTRKVVKDLKSEVKIYHFAKESNPTLHDLLTEYEGINDTKINFKVIDPQKDPGLAKQYGVRSFGETVVVSGDKHEKVETSQEEAVTNAILKVTREKNKVVYFTQGHNEVDINSQEGKGYALAKKGMENQNYEVKSVNLATSPSIPSDCSALVIAGAKVALLP